MKNPFFNPFIELKTLQDELQDARKRLRTHGKKAIPVILKQIAEIKRDIQRNTAKLQVCK